jgi:membrane-associated protease RseP (regulator of RpoE activity)
MADGDFQFPQAGYSTEPFEPVYAPPRRFQNRWWLHSLLFVATVLTKTAIGGLHYLSFVSNFGRVDPHLDLRAFLTSGLWYSGTIIAILGAHEMGHYLACRIYRVDASLPYFLPLPFPPTGTLGAVIRIREQFPSRAVLFDIGVAGPIAGFVVLVPALFVGLAMSTVVRAPEGPTAWLGEPLLFKLAAHLMFGTIPDPETLNIHPMVFAAWFGMLATALNLLPFGQLDGGHVTYALFGRKSSVISMITLSAVIGLVVFVSVSVWLVLAAMMLIMLKVVGREHPPVRNEYEPLGNQRVAIAVVALVILIVCFTPAPFSF